MNKREKFIEGFNNRYTIDTDGIVRSVERRDSLGRLVTSKVLKPKSNNRGYMTINLRKDGSRKTYTFLIHRLVALHFIDNPNNYPEVNHINEDKTKNNVENLEWCSSKYNANYRNRVERITKKIDYKKRSVKFSNKVAILDDSNKVVRKFSSQKECAKALSLSESRVCQIISSTKKTKSGLRIQRI